METPREVVNAHLCRITDWPHIKDREGFKRFADVLQAAVFVLDCPDYRHELLSGPLCTLLVRKIHTGKR